MQVCVEVLNGSLRCLFQLTLRFKFCDKARDAITSGILHGFYNSALTYKSSVTALYLLVFISSTLFSLLANIQLEVVIVCTRFVINLIRTKMMSMKSSELFPLLLFCVQ